MTTQIGAGKNHQTKMIPMTTCPMVVNGEGDEDVDVDGDSD